MNRCPQMFAWSAAMLLACAAAVSCRPTIALAEPPAMSDDSAKAAAENAKAAADNAKVAAENSAEDARLEARLEEARKRLDEAAHQVAELTAQLSRPVIESFMEMDSEHSRAIIGVQLDPAPGGPGARVREVSPGGPSAEAGIRVGDRIVAVNGTEVKGENPARQVSRLMRAVKPDSKVSVRVLREGTPREFSVVARSSPNYFFANFPSFNGPEILSGGPRESLMIRGPIMDMELVTLTPQLGRYFGSDKGVLVVRAPEQGALKLEAGDVILAIDGREPSSGSHATRILASYQPGEKVTLRIVRMHKTLDLAATLPEPEHEHRHAEGRVRGAVPMPPMPPVPPAPAVAPPPDQT
jgi:S1-C subfamily serine protease